MVMLFSASVMLSSFKLILCLSGPRKCIASLN